MKQPLMYYRRHPAAIVWGILSTVARVVWRFWSGAHMDGVRRSDASWIRPGRTAAPTYTLTWWTSRCRWARVGVRLAVLVGLALTVSYPWWPDTAHTSTLVLGGALALWLLVRLRRRMSDRRFRRRYVAPLTSAVREVIETAAVDVDRDLSDLSARLAAEMRPVEVTIRRWYGARIEPVIRWLPERIWRLRARTATKIAPLTAQFIRPKKESQPSVTVRVANVFVTPEMQKLVGQRVYDKLGLSDLTCRWNQVGTEAKGVWTVTLRPPARVTYADLKEYVNRIPESEFFIGMGAGNLPVTASLDSDSPHMACSAGTGAGKSVLAMLVGSQVLARSGKVLLLDMKGSHRWARGLTEEDGVVYCTRPAEMHDALIAEAEIADLRNQRAIDEPEDWDPGPRHLIVFEEMNATISRLASYWDSIREKNDPKLSPAIQAFRDIMYMGRSAKINIFGVAQMLTARTTGGPESRENFGVRFLSRYTRNNWKMLVPECAMPKASKTRGLWQMVVAGQATAVQVAFGSAAELREFITTQRNTTVVPIVPTQPDARAVEQRPDGTPSTRPDTDGDALAASAAEFGPLTLQTAIDEGILSPERTDTWKRRMLRAAADPQSRDIVPVPVATQGRANLYAREDMRAFSEWYQARESAKTKKKSEDE